MDFRNYFWVSFVLWPSTTVLAALCNMLIWLEFSGTELIFDALTGIGLGTCFWLFTNAATRTWWKTLLMVFTHGIFGLLALTSLFPSVACLFWWCAGSTVGATILAAALDHAAVALGADQSAGATLLSVLLFLLKAPFCLFTTAVGLLIFIAGLIHLGASGAGAGFLGGVFYSEWDRQATPVGAQATTVGATVHCWRLRFCQNMCHELNHSRQYIYMRDLMIPSWCIGFLVTGGEAGEPNPIERVAYQIEGPASVTLPPDAPCTPCAGAAAPAPAPPPSPKPAPKPKP